MILLLKVTVLLQYVNIASINVAVEDEFTLQDTWALHLLCKFTDCIISRFTYMLKDLLIGWMYLTTCEFIITVICAFVNDWSLKSMFYNSQSHYHGSRSVCIKSEFGMFYSAVIRHKDLQNSWEKTRNQRLRFSWQCMYRPNDYRSNTSQQTFVKLTSYCTFKLPSGIQSTKLLWKAMQITCVLL